MTTTSPNRRYSGHHKATEEGILGKEIWRKKCGQQDTSTAGGRWRGQHKTELDADKWSVDYYVPQGASRRKSQSTSRVQKRVYNGLKCRLVPVSLFASVFDALSILDSSFLLGGAIAPSGTPLATPIWSTASIVNAITASLTFCPLHFRTTTSLLPAPILRPTKPLGEKVKRDRRVTYLLAGCDQDLSTDEKANSKAKTLSLH